MTILTLTTYRAAFDKVCSATMCEAPDRPAPKSGISAIGKVVSSDIFGSCSSNSPRAINVLRCKADGIEPSDAVQLSAAR